MFMKEITVSLEDAMNDLLWECLQNDFTLHTVADELLNKEGAIIARKSGFSKNDFIKANAYLLKNYVVLSLMPNTGSVLNAELWDLFINTVDFEAISRKFFEESI